MLRLLSRYSPSDVIQERCDKSVAHSASWPVTACMNRHPISDAMIVRRPRGTVRVKRPLASVSPAADWFATETRTAWTGCPVRSSTTVPETVPGLCKRRRNQHQNLEVACH
jgi:hypothetical protein